MKVEKISPANIPVEHYKWAGIQSNQTKPKKNNLSIEHLNRIIKKAYYKKFGIYNNKGEFVPFVKYESKRSISETH